MNKPRLFAELPAGLASVSLRLHGGKHCRPPISRQGSKQGYGEAILGALGLRSGSGADRYLWAEADPDVAALLRCYPDADMLRRVAEIIRGWADEEPRALWERLRGERRARTVRGGVDDMAEWCALQGGVTLSAPIGTRGENADKGLHPNRNPNFHGGNWPVSTSEGLERIARWAEADRCHRLAEYAAIVSGNRLINVSGPDLMNTGNGGTRFGGDFATPVGDVAAAFERVAGEVAEASYLHQGSFQYKGPDAGIGRPEGMEAHGTHGAIRPVVSILGDAFPRLALGWPPVLVLPLIPEAADVAAWMGTPGDLEGCVVYADPPYVGTTGYAATLPRAEVIHYALAYSSLGATVVISEATPIAELEGWHATEITDGRKGQKRTFSKQQGEWLTMNRAPVDTIWKQMGLFG